MSKQIKVQLSLAKPEGKESKFDEAARVCIEEALQCIEDGKKIKIGFMEMDVGVKIEDVQMSETDATFMVREKDLKKIAPIEVGIEGALKLKGMETDLVLTPLE